MNKKEFKAMMSKVTTFYKLQGARYFNVISHVQALPKKDASKMEKHVFRVYDTNGDGFIDFVEFMVSCGVILCFYSV